MMFVSSRSSSCAKLDIEVAIDGGVQNIFAKLSPADRLASLTDLDVRNRRSGVVTQTKCPADNQKPLARHETAPDIPLIFDTHAAAYASKAYGW